MLATILTLLSQSGLRDDLRSAARWPYLCKDIELLEKVQRRNTRLMFSDKLLGYYDRLRN